MAIVVRTALHWSLVLVAALALSLAAMVAADATEVPASDEPRELTGDVGNGALLYSQWCASCHGIDGTGGEVPEYGGVAPALVPRLNENIEAAYLYLVMATGRMPPPGSPYDNRHRELLLDEQEIADVIAWMRAELELPGVVPVVDAEGDISDGQQVWLANCTHCHGTTGDGGVAGAGAWTPSVTDKSPTVIASAIRVGPFQMPQFEQDQISEEEIGAVVAYLREIRTDSRTPVLGLLELNPVYASAFVAILAVLVVFSLIWIGSRPAWLADGGQEGDGQVPAGARPKHGRTPTEVA